MESKIYESIVSKGAVNAMQHERTEDLPQYLKWTMTFINRVGFPILVCIWLAYQQFILEKEIIKNLQANREVMLQMKESIEAQSRIFKFIMVKD